MLVSLKRTCWQHFDGAQEEFLCLVWWFWNHKLLNYPHFPCHFSDEQNIICTMSNINLTVKKIKINPYIASALFGIQNITIYDFSVPQVTVNMTQQAENGMNIKTRRKKKIKCLG